MKNIYLTILVLATVLLFSCFRNSEAGNGKIPKKKLLLAMNVVKLDQECDSMIRKFLQDSICTILLSSDSVVAKQIVRKASVDSVKNDTSYFNVEEKVGYLNKKQTGLLHYILLSDSTYNWTKIKIKHAFEPELVCQFVKGTTSVSLLISPASQEFAFGYKNTFLRKEYRADPLIDRLIGSLQMMKRNEITKGKK